MLFARVPRCALEVTRRALSNEARGQAKIRDQVTLRDRLRRAGARDDLVAVELELQPAIIASKLGERNGQTSYVRLHYDVQGSKEGRGAAGDVALERCTGRIVWIEAGDRVIGTDGVVSFTGKCRAPGRRIFVRIEVNPEPRLRRQRAGNKRHCQT